MYSASCVFVTGRLERNFVIRSRESTKTRRARVPKQLTKTTTADIAAAARRSKQSARIKTLRTFAAVELSFARAAYFAECLQCVSRRRATRICRGECHPLFPSLQIFNNRTSAGASRLLTGFSPIWAVSARVPRCCDGVSLQSNRELRQASRTRTAIHHYTCRCAKSLIQSVSDIIFEVNLPRVRRYSNRILDRYS